MQCFLFHLMPYANLDLDYDKKYKASWVVYPNSNFDPEIGRYLYNTYLDELELGEELGFDGLCINEHHQNAYGLMPSPIVPAAALARRTTKSKIAVLGNAFGIREHPLTLAEEHAMIDCITGGRLITGMVRGIGAEYYSMGANPAFSHERFHEAHDLVIRAWTDEGPFAHEGKHYQFEYVNVWPRPFQKPHPPIWCPSQGSLETIEWSSHPDRRYTYLQTYSPFEAVKKFLQMYRDVARDTYGYEAADSQVGWAAPIYIGETDEKAIEESRPHMEAFFNKFLRMTPEMLLPPGYLSLRSYKNVMKHKGGLSKVRTLEELIETGIVLCGSPDTVRKRLEYCQNEAGVGHFLGMFQVASMPHDMTVASMKRFAAEVMPAAKQFGRYEQVAAE